MTNTAPPARFTWVTALTLVFLGWAVFIAQFIYRANRTDRELVADRPYEQGLAYEDQIAALRAAAPWRAGIRVQAQPAGIVLSLPADLPARMQEAKLQLLRPDRRAADRTLLLPANLGASQVLLPAAGLRSGHWRVRLRWALNGQPCLYETNLYVP